MSTKTAYASRLSDEEVAEQTKDMSPKDREEFRIENAIRPLFDMWLRFEQVFADRAIDRLAISDEDAEAAAARIEGHGFEAVAFAYLLRQIPHARYLRNLCHKATALWENGAPEMLSIPEIHERYEKLPKGKA